MGEQEKSLAERLESDARFADHQNLPAYVSAAFRHAAYRLLELEGENERLRGVSPPDVDGYLAVNKANYETIQTQQATISHLQAQLAEAREALSRFHNVFVDYALQHEAKGTPDGAFKAKRNRDLAAEAASCLNSTSPSEEGSR